MSGKSDKQAVSTGTECGSGGAVHSVSGETTAGAAKLSIVNCQLSIGVVGAGNVAWHLAPALARAGWEVAFVASRSLAHARSLSERVSQVTGHGSQVTKQIGCRAYSLADLASHASKENTCHLSPVTCHLNTPQNARDSKPEIILISVSDNAVADVAAQVVPLFPHALFVHTAGSVGLDVFDGALALAKEKNTCHLSPVTCHLRASVLYPLQTFSKAAEVDVSQVPFFVEANSADDLALITSIASSIGGSTQELSSERRRRLHLASVLACNFVNSLYAEAADIARSIGVGFDALLPLIDETARKVHRLAPRDAQTGPAARGDTKTIGKHLAMLEDDELRALYALLSKRIMQRKK